MSLCGCYGIQGGGEGGVRCLVRGEERRGGGGGEERAGGRREGSYGGGPDLFFFSVLCAYLKLSTAVGSSESFDKCEWSCGSLRMRKKTAGGLI